MTEQKTGIRPKVGDMVWVGRGKSFTWKIVTKVGKKYFYTEKTYKYLPDVRFEIGCKNGAAESGDVFQPSVVYESESAFNQKVDTDSAISELYQVTGRDFYPRYTPPPNVTASDIRRAIAILKGES
jgi:hypothetical protein